jgi:SRSO17 transposase
MIGRALDAGVPAGWVTGDEVYGANPVLRAALEARSIGYALAVACDHPVVAAGDTYRADALLRGVPARAWQQVSCGNGAKGHRYYDWAFIRLDHDHDPAPGQQQGQHWLMIRRHRKTRELAFYRCWMPRPVPLAVLVRVAGTRWTVEERFQTEGPVWPGPASAPPLAVLVPLGHADDARPRLPGGGRHRTQLPAVTVGAHPVDLQRGPAPIRGPGCSARW